MTPFYEPYAESIKELGLVKQELNDIQNFNDTQKQTYFYTDKQGNIFPYYKEDIKKVINVLKPSTFLPIFQELDIPFYEEVWLENINRCIESNGNLSNIFGRYLAWCKLFDIKNRGFKDSNKFFIDIYEYRNHTYQVK